MEVEQKNSVGVLEMDIELDQQVADEVNSDDELSDPHFDAFCKLAGDLSPTSQEIYNFELDRQEEAIKEWEQSQMLKMGYGPFAAQDEAEMRKWEDQVDSDDFSSCPAADFAEYCQISTYREYRARCKFREFIGDLSATPEEAYNFELDCQEETIKEWEQYQMLQMGYGPFAAADEEAMHEWEDEVNCEYLSYEEEEALAMCLEAYYFELECEEQIIKKWQETQMLKMLEEEEEHYYQKIKVEIVDTKM